MPYAKDGTPHHSFSRASTHDQMQSQSKSKEPAEQSAKSSYPAPSPQSIENHVAEHGPAHGLHHQHDKGGDGKHHVSSFHGDAQMGDMKHPHTHHSVHDSHEAAHEHIGKAFGLHEGAPDEENQAQDMPTPDTEAAVQSRGHGRIPGLA